MPAFQGTAESLKAYRCPDWFRDAKFGIYVHWGVYSVPAQGEWYARNMYIPGQAAYDHHTRTYGHPSTFGYKDLIPLWRAEKFDPDRLVGLFKDAGARYFTPCAIHHDNFDLWNSKHHRWNSVNMGPEQDITGLWRTATLKHGLRWGVTTHLERTYSWFNVNKGADREGPHAGVPYDGADPALADFYIEAHEDTDLRHPLNPPASWRAEWARRIKDLIDNYQPDRLYLDGAIPFQGDDDARTGMELMAYYYNRNQEWHGGRQECVMCIKDHADHGTYIPGVATQDMERSLAGDLLEEPWQTDTSIGPWGYHTGAPYRPVRDMIRELIDIVSKNGNMLLNVPPRADGTLDSETETILRDIGAWMRVNGEGIYETRPWHTYGDGSLRFTTKGDTLYAFELEWPGERRTLDVPISRADGSHRAVATVGLLGHPGDLEWAQHGGRLAITLPPRQPSEHLAAFRIDFR